MSVDPLTNKYPELTPYQFASNTPIQAIDLDGLEGASMADINSYNQQQVQMHQFKAQLPAPKSIPTPKVSLTDAAVIKAKQPIIKGPLITSAEYNIRKGCRNCGTLSAPQPQPMFNNDFERGMVTNPLIQGTATTMAAPFVAGGTMATGEWLFTPQAMGWGSLAAGTSDILIQGASTNWDITKYTPVSTIGSMAFHNPFGWALFAIGFQATIKDNGFTVHAQSLSQTATQVSLFATGTNTISIPLVNFPDSVLNIRKSALVVYFFPERFFQSNASANTFLQFHVVSELIKNTNSNKIIMPPKIPKLNGN